MPEQTPKLAPSNSIDHFLLNARAAKMLVAGGVEREVRGWEKTSDHAPTWITLAPKLKTPSRRVRRMQYRERDRSIARSVDATERRNGRQLARIGRFHEWYILLLQTIASN
jgi:hypothetical protein